MFVDTALRDREVAGGPIRVGMIGAGATGRAIALQLGTPAPGNSSRRDLEPNYSARRTGISRSGHYELAARGILSRRG